MAACNRKFDHFNFEKVFCSWVDRFNICTHSLFSVSSHKKDKKIRLLFWLYNSGGV